MISHYLIFNRNCAQALQVYCKAFNTQITEIRKYGDIQDPGFKVEEKDKDLVLHARFKLGDTEIMCADSDERYEPGTNMYITVTTKDADLVKSAWNILKADGEIYIDLTPSFFAELHGSLRDKFGINWMFTVME